MNEENTSFEDRFRIEQQELDDAPISGNTRYSRRRSRGVGAMKVIALAGGVIALLVVMVIVFKNTGTEVPLSEKNQGDPIAGNMAMISLLEQRMERMETAFAGIMEKVSTTKAGPAGTQSDMDVFSGRVDRVETAMAAKFNILVENLDKLDIQMADVVNRVKALEKGRSGSTVVRERSQPSVSSVKKTAASKVSSGKTSSQSSADGSADKKIALKKSRVVPQTIPAMGKKSASTHVYHVVQKGETFYSISRKYNITVDTLHKLNHFSKQPTIYPGDKLIVK